ncbi:TetR/AcrR family transcriptional regulator [Streptomyces sp. NPDC047002]|uniref:TetR/AcrR family transcriptional regulator n=1 Tax=Streptomyces sp. NPDC047002 TaxID=3155475 RepID=UPI003454E99B
MARPRKFDERAVLLAARGRFRRYGYAATSMQDLCEAAGVASQSLYGAFGSKHGLYVRTLEDYCAEQLAGLRAGRERARSPWAWLLAAVTYDDGGTIGLSDDGCYLSGSASALSRLDSTVNAIAERTYARTLELLTATVREAQAAGEIRTDVSADDIGAALLTAMQGIEFLLKSGLGEEACAHARRSVVEGLRRAYARPTPAPSGCGAQEGPPEPP